MRVYYNIILYISERAAASCSNTRVSSSLDVFITKRDRLIERSTIIIILCCNNNNKDDDNIIIY